MTATAKAPREVVQGALQIPRLVDAMVLGAASAESWVCPADTRIVLISCDNPVYVRAGATAVVPTTEVTDGTAPLQILATGEFEVEEGVTYSFIRGTSNSTIVTIARYS